MYVLNVYIEMGAIVLISVNTPFVDLKKMQLNFNVHIELTVLNWVNASSFYKLFENKLS